MPILTTVYVDNDLLREIKSNITHEFRLPDAFRQILLKGLADFDDVVLPYFRDEEYVAHLKDPKFRNKRNGQCLPVEFPTEREMRRFQKATKEAGAQVERTLDLSGIRVHHIIRAIFRSWLDEKLEATLTV